MSESTAPALGSRPTPAYPPAIAARGGVGVRAWLTGLTFGLVCLALLLGLSAGHAFDGARVLASAQRMGPGTLGRGQALMQQITESARLGESARLDVINDFFNQRVLYRDDLETWGVVDYWASPLETLSKGQGDCEDYAIGKYFSLIAAGVPSAKMRMVYVRAQVGGTIQAHMVLAYYPYPNAEPLILDNLVPEIREASRRPDLAPVFSFNAEGLWQGVAGASAGDPAARLSKWREVFAKAKAEGWW
jgi:predicted transglutaminase-like cysteine proteinase